MNGLDASKNTSFFFLQDGSAMSPKGGGWLGFAPPWWFKNRPWMTSMEAPSFKLSKLTNSFPYHHNTTHLCASTLWSSLSLIKPKFWRRFWLKAVRKRRRKREGKMEKPWEMGGRANSVFAWLDEREMKWFTYIFISFSKNKNQIQKSKKKNAFSITSLYFSHITSL